MFIFGSMDFFLVFSLCLRENIKLKVEMPKYDSSYHCEHPQSEVPSKIFQRDIKTSRKCKLKPNGKLKLFHSFQYQKRIDSTKHKFYVVFVNAF
jgi:hypothetical protein